MFFFQHYIIYLIDSILNSIILKPPSFSPRRAGAALIRGFHGHCGVREGGQAGARGAGWMGFLVMAGRMGRTSMVGMNYDYP